MATPDFPEDTPHPGALGKLAVHGLLWNYFGVMITASVQLVFTAVMARLLDPAAFGLLAMANFFLRYAAFFSQLGVVSALIQKSNLTEEEVRGARTVSIILGSVFASGFALSAPLMAAFFQNPLITPIVQALSVSFLLTSLSVTGMGLLRRRMEFKKIMFFETTAFVLGYVGIGITAAAMGFGVWSLVAASIGQGLLLVTLVWTNERQPISWRPRFSSLKQFYSFGGQVSLVGFLESVSQTADTFFIGRFLGSEPLGFYNRAFMMINLPMQYFTTSLSRVLYPYFCRIQDERGRFAAAVILSQRVAASVLIPACLIVAMSADSIIRLVLGERWMASVPILRILCFSALADLLSHFFAVASEADAALSRKILIQSSFLVILVTLFMTFRGYGLQGFSISLAAAQWMRFFSYVALARARFGISLRTLAGTYLPALLTGVLCAGGIELMRYLSSVWPISFFERAALQLVAGATILAASFLLGPQQVAFAEIKARAFTVSWLKGTPKT